MTSEKVGNPAPSAEAGKSGTFNQKIGQTVTSPQWYLNYQSFHSRAVYEYVLQHPGSCLEDIQFGLGYHRGNPANFKSRCEITNVCEILVFFRYFRKDGHRYYTTDKKPHRVPI